MKNPLQSSNIKIGSSIRVTYHASSNDRVNDNGQFKTLEGTLTEAKACGAGTQYILATAKGTRSFTSAAKIRSLEIDGMKLIREYNQA
jgi:hypothetical protein